MLIEVFIAHGSRFRACNDPLLACGLASSAFLSAARRIIARVLSSQAEAEGE